MRIDSFSIDTLDHDIGDWLGRHYKFEKFSPLKGHLDKHLLPLVKEIESHNVTTTIIGGTNGKGEVSLHLEEMALQNDLYPALWSSPHVLTARERFCFNGEMISSEDLLELFDKYSYLCKEFSYYEFLFYCFCQHFLNLLNNGSIKNRPLLILEVGLGGRLDATNYFNSDVACLTSIGRDHVELLGPNLSDILKEKIEITRSGKSLVTAVSQGILQKSIRDYCFSKNIQLFELDYAQNDSFRDVNLSLSKKVWEILLPNLSLNYKKKNLWARPLVVTDKHHEFILLGTHNLDGLKKLPALRFDDEMKKFLPANEVLVAMTRTSEDDVQQFVNLLTTFPCLGKKVVLTSFDHERATKIPFIKKSIGALIERENVVVCNDWKEKISEYAGSPDNTEKAKTLVLGSYFFMGEVFRYLLSHGYELRRS